MHKLTYFERQVLESGLRASKSVRAIARCLNRDYRVLQREANRNTPTQGAYTAALAQAKTQAREQNRHVPKLTQPKHRTLREYITSRVREDLSPEQIAGVLANQPPPELKGVTLCPETIYQYVYGEGRDQGLYQHLRRAHRKRQQRWARKPRTSPIPGRTSIHLRPEGINARVSLGHWESDTLEGKRGTPGSVSVQYERKLHLARLHKLTTKTAGETETAIHQSVRSLPEELWQSITFDNGREGATHLNLVRDFHLATYFCDPYASWQKGGVENLNGLLRQYLPKGADLSRLTEEYLTAIQERLNNRPRKSLNYLTPNQALAREVGH